MTSFGALENLSTKILSLCPYSYKCIQIQRTQPYVAPYSALDTRFRDIYIYADIDIYILTHFSSHTRQLDPHTHTHTHPHITPKHTRQSPHTSHTSHIIISHISHHTQNIQRVHRPTHPPRPNGDPPVRHNVAFISPNDNYIAPNGATAAAQGGFF